MSKTDGNVQDISVHDKDVAALAATQEAQDMSRLQRVTVPMPAFVNPNNPETAAGSVNLSLTKTPVSHAEDYGEGRGGFERLSAADAGAEDVHVGDLDDMNVGGAQIAYPEDRGEWGKKHWQGKAREYGLHTSGNTDEVKERVEGYEEQVEVAKNYNAGDWADEIENTETTDDLDELRALYAASGASFKTVDSAFEKRQSALTEES